MISNTKSLWVSVLQGKSKIFSGWSGSVGVVAIGIIVLTPENGMSGYTHFFTDVIQAVLEQS